MTCVNTLPFYNFDNGTLPVDRGDMQEILLPGGRRRLVYSYRGVAGSSKVKATLPAGMSIADRIKAKAALVERAERRSLKSSDVMFEHVVDLVVKENAGAGMPWVYNRVLEELAGPIDNDFHERYNRYIEKLIDEKKSVNTISNHKSVVRRVLNYAWKKKMIDVLPVREYDIKQHFRDRVLSNSERQRLEAAMLKSKSYLYWSIRFSERRPIRNYSDLWRLERDHLKLFGEGSPYIEIMAKKTRNNPNPRLTVYPLKDLPDILEYLLHGIPPTCPYLFPRLVGSFESVFDFDSMRRSRWYRIVEPKHEFESLLTAAKICGFHFHDFKRMSTTRMLDCDGYSPEELIDVGMYRSRRMIDLCYKKRSAMVVLRRISVVPRVVPAIQVTANS